MLSLKEIQEYLRVKAEFTKYKGLELKERNKIIGSFRYDNKEGVNHKTIDEADVDIAVTTKINRSIDKAALDTVWNELSDAEKECFNFKPELNKKAFHALIDAGEADRVMSLITEKEGQASVAIKFAE